VNEIIEDREGNLLFGTPAGICKYDGKTFAPFADNKLMNSISISSLLEDKDGNIWFGTKNNGVYRYDGKSLTNFLNKDYMFHHKIHAQLIMDMLQDKKGNIWFSSWNGGGVWRYDPAAARRTGVDSFTNFSPSADYYLSNEDGRSFNKADNDPLKYSRPKATFDYRPIDIITGTLGKALGGASGGFTSGRKEVIEMLRQRSRPYLFSNTLAPSIVGGSIAVLDLLSETTALRDKLEENTMYFRNEMTKAGFDIKPGVHPIVPIMLYEATVAQEMAAKLLEEGIYVIGFFFPVVAKGKARIRVQLSAAHEREHLDKAIAAFVKVGKEMGVI
jgi:ligand-binding sensor domain-containing protein